MVDIPSIAESVMATHVGFGVITVEMLVEAASTCFATIRLLMSVSVMIPANAPDSLTIKAASPRLLANINICVTLRILSPTNEISRKHPAACRQHYSSTLSSEQRYPAALRTPL